jgi:hypothetical protein
VSVVIELVEMLRLKHLQRATWAYFVCYFAKFQQKIIFPKFSVLCNNYFPFATYNLEKEQILPKNILTPEKLQGKFGMKAKYLHFCSKII